MSTLATKPMVTLILQRFTGTRLIAEVSLTRSPILLTIACLTGKHLLFVEDPKTGLLIAAPLEGIPSNAVSGPTVDPRETEDEETHLLASLSAPIPSGEGDSLPGSELDPSLSNITTQILYLFFQGVLAGFSLTLPFLIYQVLLPPVFASPLTGESLHCHSPPLTLISWIATATQPMRSGHILLSPCLSNSHTPFLFHLVLSSTDAFSTSSLPCPSQER
jgi:hypothetical protein